MNFLPFIGHRYDADVDADDPAHAVNGRVVIVPFVPELPAGEVFLVTISLDDIGLEV